MKTNDPIIRNSIRIAAILAICVCGLVVLVLAVPFANNDDEKDTADMATTQIQQVNVTPANLLTLEESRAEKGDKTDLQWDEFRDSLKGKQVIDWQGTINDVKEVMLGGSYYVEVDLPGNDYPYDVTLYLDKEAALALQKGQSITFSGRVRGTDIRLFGEGFTVSLENITFR